MNSILLENETLTSVNENIKLIQKKNGLTFGTDAFLLASFIKAQKNAIAVELGGGTGIISLLCASREKLAKIYCLEIQKDFADIIDRNAQLNSLDNKVSSLCADVRDIRSTDLGFEVDVVFSNPPYMKADSGKRNESDEKYIARHEVCGGIEEFCHAAARVLRYGGSFYIVYRPDRLSELMAALHKHAFEPKRMTFVHADAESEPSMVLIEARAGGNASLAVTPPLMLHDVQSRGLSHRPLSEAAQRVYDCMSFDS